MRSHSGDGSPRRWWTTRRFRWLAFAVLLIGLAYALRRPLFFGNLAVVDSDRVFRSAQPGSSLESWIRSRHLRAIVNLRGGKESDSFYAHETEVARRLGVQFHDLPLSATQRPTRRQLLDVLDLFETTGYPLLIHCKWGADRTGMVSALYRMVALNEPPERALGEFSLSYGHVPLFGPEKLHEPIQEYTSWLRGNQLSHYPRRFRYWVERYYQDGASPERLAWKTRE